MSLGTYGTTIPININDNDITNLVDIYYCYHESRVYDSLEDSTFKKLDSGSLKQSKRETEDSNGTSTEPDNILEGMYNLQLPLSDFSKKGFYTVYIKPKEIPAVIADVGYLSAYQDVRGIVIDTESISDEYSYMKTLAKTNGSLVGYRIIYFDDSGTRQDYYRVITSNNKCEPVIQAPNSSSDKSYSYRYNESSTFTFITVSPSSAPNFKSNATPYIGKPTQKILLVNTLFEPVKLDIEMVDHDLETVSTMLENSQLRDLDNGLVTTFNNDNEIYHQAEHFTLKDTTTGNPVYEVKQKRTNNIDFTQTIEDKMS